MISALKLSLSMHMFIGELRRGFSHDQQTNPNNVTAKALARRGIVDWDAANNRWRQTDLGARIQ